MSEFLLNNNSQPYGVQYFKEKLKYYYGTSIFVAEGQGLDGIVTMRDQAETLLCNYFRNAKNGDQEYQKRAIINTAAKLLKSDMKSSIPAMTDEYPSSSDLRLESALDYLPPSLQTFLMSLFVGCGKQEKVEAIGQAVVQAVRPRAVVAPLQIGLASQLHHLYKSRFLIETVSGMGFCSSYDETQRF